MDKNRQILVTILSSAIRNQTFLGFIDNDVNWNTVYEEAYAHQVHTLLYPIIKHLNFNNNPNFELFSMWENVTLTSAIRQVRHIKQISEVLKKLKEEDVPVIALKGLIIREYYPLPDLRIMGDADILIHKEDMERTAVILTKIGYITGNPTPKHLSFYHNLYPEIEVHWTLVSNKSFRNSENFSDDVWKNAICTSIYYTPVLALSPEDQILHLLLHMAGHMKKLGFGLRQLCDIVLFIEASAEIVNWDLVQKNASNYGIDRFTCVIFSLCNKLFDLEIPFPFNSKLLEYDSYIDDMINDIFDGGIFGKRTPEREECSALFHYIDDRASDNYFSNRFKRIFPIIFPSSDKLSKKYCYAQKYPFLLPFAWLHRLLNSIFRKDSIAYLKSTYLVSINVTLEKRFKLLRWLDLR